NDCGRIVREGKERLDWFDLSTLKEPYRLEGKKTMGLELAEQFEWRLPDVILYPTGGGTGPVGMWKALAESKTLGWVESEKLRLASSLEGIPICPEAAACVGALERLTAGGWIKPDEQVVVFNTGAAQKYVEAIRCDLPRIDLKQTIDWNRIESGA